MARTYENGKPSDYAREKLSTLRDRARGEYRTLLAPMPAIAMPGGDPSGLLFALLGVTAFSTGWTENTTEALLTQSFHEVGPFQCPAGPRGGPAPTQNPRAANGAYTRLASTDLVKRLNGGNAATLAHDGWKTDHRASLAVGLANFLDDERSLRGALRPGIAGASGAWSYWRFASMITAFSRGPGQAANCFNAFEAELREAPEPTRWRRYRELIVRDIRENRSGIGARKGKSGAAYAAVRTDQKLESGALLARTMGEAASAWFTEAYRPGDATDVAIEDAITRTAYGVSVESTALAAVDLARNAVDLASGASTTGKIITATLAVMLAGGVVAATRA